MPTSTQKALFGHSEAGAQNHSKSTLWGTFRPVPLSTPVNVGWDRNVRGGYSMVTIWLTSGQSPLLKSCAFADTSHTPTELVTGKPDFLEAAYAVDREVQTVNFRGNKEHPKTQHTRKRRKLTAPKICVFGCIAFSGALCSL